MRISSPDLYKIRREESGLWFVGDVAFTSAGEAQDFYRTAPVMHVFRGLPGSGKTTMANNLGCFVLSPGDMASYIGGKYCWEDGRDKQIFFDIAHTFMSRVRADIAIAEVLPTRASVQEWQRLATVHRYRFTETWIEISVEESVARNVHGVPREVIESMAMIYEA
jgi:predicted kinase